MIKIKIFCPFSNSTNCKNVYETINYACEYEFYGKTHIFTDQEDYTHAIIINTDMPKLTIPKQNVLGLAFEPIQFLKLSQTFVDYAMKHIQTYFIGDKMDLPPPFREHFGYMWHSRPLLPKEITQKPKLMSIIVSEKNFAPGHIYRHELVSKIIELGLPIDIYGRGASNWSNASMKNMNYNYNRIKGIFQDAEPYEDYMFSICIENFKSNHYFSEKVMTPLMYNCSPLYWGCNNITSYLENVLELSGVIQQDIFTIMNVLREPAKYYKTGYTEKNKKAINLIEHLPELFKSYEI